jgi:hypothetical protein
VSLEGNMNEINPESTDQGIFELPDDLFASLGETINEPSVADMIPQLGDFETPMLSGQEITMIPMQGEIKHWDRLLRSSSEDSDDSDDIGPVYEAPTENPLLPPEHQIIVDRAVRKLHKQDIDNPSNEELANAIPDSKPKLKQFVESHGIDLEDIDEIHTETPVFDSGFEQVEDDIFNEQLKAKLKEVKTGIEDREWAIVEALNSSEIPPTRENLGQTYGVSGTRIKHLNKTTLLKLRNQDSGLASFAGDYSGEFKDAAVSAFEFPSEGQVPLNDPNDARPYDERIQDYCEQDTLKWISRERETVEQNPDTLTKLNAGIDTVNQEVDTLKKPSAKS